ncbi:hypothetical protein Hanom_Chr06g00541801 [Helianthus anomalus]
MGWATKLEVLLQAGGYLLLSSYVYDPCQGTDAAVAVDAAGTGSGESASTMVQKSGGWFGFISDAMEVVLKFVGIFVSLLYDTSSDISRTTDVSQADTICTLPVLATTSDWTLGWSTKQRKHVSFVTPTSQHVRSIEPIVEQNTTTGQDLSSVHHQKERMRYSRPMRIQPHTNNVRLGQGNMAQMGWLPVVVARLATHCH